MRTGHHKSLQELCFLSYKKSVADPAYFFSFFLFTSLSKLMRTAMQSGQAELEKLHTKRGEGHAFISGGVVSDQPKTVVKLPSRKLGSSEKLVRGLASSWLYLGI